MTATIITLGYTGAKPDHLATVARKHGLVVIDTRYSPRSRNPAWNGGALAKLLQTRYQHVMSFGNENYKNGGAIQIVDLPAGVRLIRPILERGISVLLLCACEHVETCHRSVVANALSQSSGCPVVHWTPADLARLAGEGDRT